MGSIRASIRIDDVRPTIIAVFRNPLMTSSGNRRPRSEVSPSTHSKTIGQMTMHHPSAVTSCSTLGIAERAPFDSNNHPGPAEFPRSPISQKVSIWIKFNSALNRIYPESVVLRPTGRLREAP